MRVRSSMRSLMAAGPIFNTHRMVQEYTERFYGPMADGARTLADDDMARARRIATAKTRLEAAWGQVSVRAERSDGANGLGVGDRFVTTARVHLGELTPEDVAVELFMGTVDVDGELTGTRAIPMRQLTTSGDGGYLFESEPVECDASGLNGYTVRVRPAYADLPPNWQPPLLTWAATDGSTDIPPG